MLFAQFLLFLSPFPPFPPTLDARSMRHRVGIGAGSSALFRFAAPFFAMGVLCLLYDPPVPPRQEQRIRIAYLGSDNAEIARRIEQAGIPLFPVRQKLFDFFA